MKIPDEIRSKASEAVAEALGDGLDCTRVWAAWGVGTMSADDFVPIAESGDRVDEIAQAVLNVVEEWLRGSQSPETPSIAPGFQDVRSDLAEIMSK